MALKFKVDVSGMDTVKEAIAKACTKAEHKVAGQVLSDTAPFVPAAGNAAGLTNRARVVGNSVIYPGPYARYLYYGKLYGRCRNRECLGKERRTQGANR